MKLTEQELRELINLHLKSALGGVMDFDVAVLVERLNRCRELVVEFDSLKREYIENLEK